MVNSTMRAALIVVDMQEDFYEPNGALAVSGSMSIVTTINNLLRWPGWRLRLATMDRHPQDHISFASNHPGKQPFTSSATILNPENAAETQFTTLWPDHCVKGSRGAGLISGLHAHRLTHTIYKGQDKRVESYSGFGPPFRNPAMGMSKLDHILKSGSGSGAPISHVFVVGLAYDYCVKFTAMDAVEHGYKTFVIEDATKAVSPDENNLNKTRSFLKQAGVEIITLGADILEEIKAGSRVNTMDP